MTELYTKVKHTDYMKLIERNGELEKENAKLKADLKKVTARIEVKAEPKTENKKGGNK